MKFFVYLLESEMDGSFYIGQTQNIEERITKHNAGYSKYTKTKMPWNLKYYISVNSRKEAMALETKIKNLKSRKAIIHFFEHA